MNVLLSSLLLCVVCFVLYTKADNTTYTTKYDGVDLDEILANDRMLTAYVNCLLDKGPCTPDGKELKNDLPDAIDNDCRKCTLRQKEGSESVMHYIIDHRPEDWTKLEKKLVTRIKTDLENLRNTIVFAFVMLNALFVMVIFLLQLRQDLLHIKWPFGQKVTITYDDDANVVIIDQDYLTLEPIGSMFILFFGIVMGIQFLGMLSHRFGTITHLLSTVQLNWYFAKKPNEMSDEAEFEKRAVEIARDLQRLNVDDLGHRGVDESAVARRRTLHDLERARSERRSAANLDANFKRRLTILQDSDPNVVATRLPSLGANPSSRRATLRALMTRRDSVLAEKRRSQLRRDSTTGYIYDDPMNELDSVSGRPSGAPYVNRGYEPAFDSDDDDRPRRSTVRFRQYM